MASLNLCVMIGNLTRDPELKYTPGGAPVAKFSIAVNRISGGGDTGKEKREEVLFLRCTAFQKTAELAHTYCKKGDPVCVTGHLQENSWEDRETGNKRSQIELIVDRMQFLKGRDQSSESTKSRDDSSAAF